MIECARENCLTKEGSHGAACFSACENYRFMLFRSWIDGLFETEMRLINFLMLNPSTASQDQDDPTIRRCIGFAKKWGFNSLVITNIFALRSTNPAALFHVSDPIGKENDAHLFYWSIRAEKTVCAWGNHGLLKERGKIVKDGLSLSAKLYYLEMTKEKQPKHPLYIAANQPLSEWN